MDLEHIVRKPLQVIEIARKLIEIFKSKKNSVGQGKPFLKSLHYA